MAIYDIHSHWGTERGYALRGKPREKQKLVFGSEPRVVTEAGMAEDFRQDDMKVILDLGYTKFIPLEEVAPLHDYAFETQRAFPDVILGNWVQIHPSNGEAGVKELRRCIDKRSGFLGMCVTGAGVGPASDPMWTPFYKLCIEAKIPVLILLGLTGQGAGMPGGDGLLIDDCHPRHLDWVAAKYPEMTIVAGRPAWPWQAEAIAVMLHKREIWYELHGWSPKHHGTDLKHDISRRLQDRVMFGADYPMFSHQRLLNDWRNEGYSEAILEKIFTKNAERFFAELGQ